VSTAGSTSNGVYFQILEAFHHPYFVNGNSEIQRQMMNHLEQWIGGLGHDDAQKTLQALTKVRALVIYDSSEAVLTWHLMTGKR
jgi:hypothetical protein